MTNSPYFKGGPIFLNSGGTGPDDYLIKPVKGGRWTRVIFRWGRNYKGDSNAAVNDKAAMKKIFPLQHVAVSDNARRWTTMKARGNVPTMNGTEFWEKYGDAIN